MSEITDGTWAALAATGALGVAAVLVSRRGSGASEALPRWEPSEEQVEAAMEHARVWGHRPTRAEPTFRVVRLPWRKVFFIDFGQREYRERARDPKGGPRYVRTLMDRMEEGTPLPPASGFWYPEMGRYALDDGNHRASAARRLKLADIPVLVYDGPALAAASGSRAGPSVRGRAQAQAKRCAPEAGPGIRSELRPGEILVFRTSRQAAETEAICKALARGKPEEAFRASVHTDIRPGMTGTSIGGHGATYVKAMERAVKKGKAPLFTSPYVTTAAIYRGMSGYVVGQSSAERGTVEPVTWAIAVPEDAVIWTNARTYNTNGIFHLLTYCDAEEVIDAPRVRKVWHVPAELVEAIAERTDELASRYKVAGGFRGSWKDRDADIAAAALDAVLDLRVPPKNLGRPFLETPVPVAGGMAKKGDRVLLADGQVAPLVGWTFVEPVYRGHWYGQTHRAAVGAPFIGWGGSAWSLHDGANLTGDLVVRVLGPKERVSRAEQVATYRANRARLRARLLEDLDARERQRDAMRAAGQDTWLPDREIPAIRADLLLLDREDPPWGDPMAHAAVLRYGKKPRKGKAS